jgi:hypothetical protein
VDHAEKCCDPQVAYLCIGFFMDCVLWNTRAFLSFSMYRQMNRLWNFLQLGFVISISVYLSLSQRSPYYCRILFRITWFLGIVHHLILKTECDILGTIAVPILRLQCCQALTWLWPTESLSSVTVPFFEYWVMDKSRILSVIYLSWNLLEFDIRMFC